QLWGPICDEQMMLAGVQNVQKVNTATATLVVVDGDTDAKSLLASTGERGHALVVTDSPPPDCDMVITQVGEREMVVQVGKRQIVLDILPMRNETNFLNRARGNR